MSLSLRFSLVLLLCFACDVLCLQNTETGDIIFNYNNTYKYGVTYTVYVNKSIEYIMEFAGDPIDSTSPAPARVTIASNFADRTYPLFVTARQQKGVFSWQLPMLVQSPGSLEQFSNISRTLCPHNNLYAPNEEICDVTSLNTPIVHLTSASPDQIEATILVETVEDFYIKLNSTTNLTSTPSQPKYYFFPFDQGSKLDIAAQNLKRKSECSKQMASKEQDLLMAHYESTNFESYGWMSRPKSVIVEIESDDDICAVVSIQNFSCPVFDNERDILYDGYYLTMTRRGGITLTVFGLLLSGTQLSFLTEEISRMVVPMQTDEALQDTFPVGFYIVFIVKSTDEDCLDSKSNYTRVGSTIGSGRVKNFSFKIIQTISYQDYMIAAGAVLAFFLSFYVGFIVVLICQIRQRRIECMQSSSRSEEGTISTECTASTTNLPTRRRNVNINSSTQNLVEETHNSSSSDTESDYTNLDSVDNEMSLNPKTLCVANLARCRPRVLSARSKMYLFNVLTVAVFYTLPVIQLVITYQRLLNQSGNQDLCYFNFLCAHPFLMLSDFNHVYSNLGYLLLGILFLICVWRRQRELAGRDQEEKQLGIPQHFGLLYAMGIALVSEGLLSAAYHVCPNSMNFQFDTSFMYVTSVLCMVKIYQSRHADVNARAHATFAVLAIIIFIGLVGVLNANLYFWVLFTILHLVTCLIMTFQIYYLGRFRLDAGVLSSALRRVTSRPLQSVTPARLGRCLLLAIANVANWALAAYGVAQHSADFASHLLLVLMSNLFLYTLFYIVMKLLHRETILWYTWVYIVLTYGIWFSSSYFYLDQSTNWALTPAQSRQSNRVCSLLQLYDSHDIWHFMSSTAMFFSFNMYLTIDDNLINVPRTKIMVF